MNLIYDDDKKSNIFFDEEAFDRAVQKVKRFSDELDILIETANRACDSLILLKKVMEESGISKTPPQAHNIDEYFCNPTLSCEPFGSVTLCDNHNNEINEERLNISKEG